MRVSRLGIRFCSLCAKVGTRNRRQPGVDPFSRILHFSTNALSRARASSHCRETCSRYSCISTIGRGWNSYKVSRPERAHRTSPAPASTRRCLVTAWRVRRDPSVSCAMERGCPEDSLATSDILVASPRAANSAHGRGPPERRLGLRDIVFDVLHLLCPATVILEERLGAPRCRNVFKARFGDCQQCTSLSWLKMKLHQRGRLA